MNIPLLFDRQIPVYRTVYVAVMAPSSSHHGIIKTQNFLCRASCPQLAGAGTANTKKCYGNTNCAGKDRFIQLPTINNSVVFSVCRFADGKLRAACPTNGAVFLMVIFRNSKIQTVRQTEIGRKNGLMGFCILRNGISKRSTPGWKCSFVWCLPDDNSGV